jgi:hypothetical protein
VWGGHTSAKKVLVLVLGCGGYGMGELVVCLCILFGVCVWEGGGRLKGGAAMRPPSAPPSGYGQRLAVRATGQAQAPARKP